MYERPGAAFYVPSATKAVNAHEPATEHGVVGAAIKTTALPWTQGFDVATNTLIKVGEKFTIRTKGIHQFDTSVGKPSNGVAAGVLGEGVYIRPATNILVLESANAAGDLPFGRIVEITGNNRGVPANKVRIDLDQKDTLPVAA